MVNDKEYELVQDDEIVAGTSGANAFNEIQNYAAQYVQDGPVEIYEVTRRKIDPAAAPQVVADEWATFEADAIAWGNALNEAAWEFTDVCPEKSTLLFNHCKTALRAAIIKYVEHLRKNQVPPAAPVQAQEPVDWQEIALFYQDLYSKEKHCTPAQDSSVEKSNFWFDCLYKCAKLLELDDHTPIPSGVVSAVEKLVSARVQPVAVPDVNTVKQAVNRFLCWPIPKDFSPDCGIAFDGRKDDEWNKNKTWPIGTNLFTSDQAKAMFEHCLAAPAAQCDAKEIFQHTGGKRYEKLGELKAKVGDTGWWNAVRYRSLEDGQEYVTDSDRWHHSFTAIAAKAAS